MKLTDSQVSWLTRLINHKKGEHYITSTERSIVEHILKRGTYDTDDQILLQSIVDYYISNKYWYGYITNIAVLGILTESLVKLI